MSEIDEALEALDEAMNLYEESATEPCLCGNPDTEPTCPHCSKAIKAQNILNTKVRQALEAPAVPEGWQLVPVEMTGTMQNAVARNKLERMKGGYTEGPDKATLDDWSAALGAAPEPGERDG